MIRISAAMAVFVFSGPVLASAVEDTPSADWTGGYVGLQIETFDGDSAISGPFEGDVYGLSGGYRFDFGTFVVGGELDYTVGELEQNGVEVDIDGLMRLGIEAGYDAGSVLVYATAGLARLELSQGGTSGGDNGLFYGVGADILVTDRVTLGAEILRHDFNDFNNFPGNDLDFTTIGINIAYGF